jgi:hypothetical protein
VIIILPSFEDQYGMLRFIGLRGNEAYTSNLFSVRDLVAFSILGKEKRYILVKTDSAISYAASSEIDRKTRRCKRLVILKGGIVRRDK